MNFIYFWYQTCLYYITSVNLILIVLATPSIMNRAANPEGDGGYILPIFDPHPRNNCTNIPPNLTGLPLTDMVYKNSVRRQILNFISSRHGNFLHNCNLKYEILSLSIAF